MGSFLTGVLQGNVDTATKMKKAGTPGVLRKKKKTASQVPMATPYEFKRGGKVKRGGRAVVHKGERVLTKKQAKRYRGKKR